MIMHVCRISLLFFIFLLVPCRATADSRSEEAAWSALRAGDHVVLIRHAVTEPGIGDPEGFRIGDCRTQRNLSAQGREDAARIGDAFRRRGIVLSDVLSSRWCRCIDTARLAFGRATQVSMLDSMFNDRVKPAEEKMREVFAYLARWTGEGNLVLVTHNQNIQALTGVSPASGEIVVVTPVRKEGKQGEGELRVVGRIASPVR